MQQKDLSLGRFGNWHRSPATWSGYHPDTHDYQTQGSCKRKIFRILNLGTRFNLLKESHFHEAFVILNKMVMQLLLLLIMTGETLQLMLLILIVC